MSKLRRYLPPLAVMLAAGNILVGLAILFSLSARLPYPFDSVEKELLTDIATMEKWVQDRNPKLSVQTVSRIVAASIESGEEFSLEPTLLIAMATHESNLNPEASSSAGARGLMQVMPNFHQDKLKGRNPSNIETSIWVGAEIFHNCQKRFKWRQDKTQAFACYSGFTPSTVAPYQRKVESLHANLNKALVRARAETKACTK